jgi:hypothetical protein
MTSIDPKEAAAALSDIDSIVHRVRQSWIYDIASQIMIVWGVLVFAGNVATSVGPGYAGAIWISVNLLGAVGTVAISASGVARDGSHGFDPRLPIAYLLFFTFGYLCSSVLGHYTPRQMGAFWPIYFMLFYATAGMWFGYAFFVIGLAISALTLIGYFYIEGGAFLLWMAFVNGGGLILGGLWMRRS